MDTTVRGTDRVPAKHSRNAIRKTHPVREYAAEAPRFYGGHKKTARTLPQFEGPGGSVPPIA